MDNRGIRASNEAVSSFSNGELDGLAIEQIPLGIKAAQYFHTLEPAAADRPSTAGGVSFTGEHRRQLWSIEQHY